MLEDLFPHIGTYALNYEVGMSMACVTLRLSLINSRCVGHLQWYSIRKAPTPWANLYGDVVLSMGDTIFARDGIKVHRDSMSYLENIVWKALEMI